MTEETRKEWKGKKGEKMGFRMEWGREDNPGAEKGSHSYSEAHGKRLHVMECE